MHELVSRGSKVPRQRDGKMDRCGLSVPPLGKSSAVSLDAAVHNADAPCMAAGDAVRSEVTSSRSPQAQEKAPSAMHHNVCGFHRAPRILLPSPFAPLLDV